LGLAEYIQALNDAYNRLKEKLKNLKLESMCPSQELEDLKRQLRVISYEIAIASQELYQAENPFLSPPFPPPPPSIF
jgi:chromosome segregation ATPase